MYLARKIPHIQITLSLGGEEYDKVKEEDALAHLSDQIISFKWKNIQQLERKQII